MLNQLQMVVQDLLDKERGPGPGGGRVGLRGRGGDRGSAIGDQGETLTLAFLYLQGLYRRDMLNAQPGLVEFLFADQLPRQHVPESVNALGVTLLQCRLHVQQLCNSGSTILAVPVY